MKLSGYVQLPAAAPPVDPSANGFGFFVTDDVNRNIFIRRELPAGTNWKQSINKRLWTYSDPTGAVGGIRKASIIIIPLKGPNYYKVSVSGTNGDFLLPTSKLPVNLSFVMGGSDQAIAGLCATQMLSPLNGPAPVCKTIGTILTCK